MANPDSKNTISSAAGLSGGTGFAGLVLLLPDGTLKSILLILSPTITIVVSSFWHVVTEEIESKVADWRIRSQKKRAAELYERLLKEGSADEELKEKAKKKSRLAYLD